MRRFYFRAPCWANGEGAGFTRSFGVGDPARSGPILRAVAQSIPGEFPTTHWSLVLTAGQGGSPEAEAALERLCVSYRAPVRSYLLGFGIALQEIDDSV